MMPMTITAPASTLNHGFGFWRASGDANGAAEKVSAFAMMVFS
jgi:hypothetical protein